ncbi:MAG: peroxiredoxin [Myxococcales bacterium]|jgi:2-Cys peroxiredoxin 5|nr:peroxiredoxin [Myxococcales bacterium]
MSIQTGDKLPSGTLHEKNPGDKVDVAELSAGKTVVLFAVPGAFTPGCSRTHLPGYVADAESIKAKGVDEIVCVSVNDAFVMQAWGDALGATGKVRMLADPAAAFTRALGLEVEAAGLGGTRSKRYSMIIKDGVVTALNVEPDGFGLSCSLSPSILSQLG